MEQFLVALLTLNIAFSSGSILHGAPSDGHYPQLLPYELTYSPIILAQPNGLSIQGAVATGNPVHLPAPVVEDSAEDAIPGRVVLQTLNKSPTIESIGTVADGLSAVISGTASPGQILVQPLESSAALGEAISGTVPQEKVESDVSPSQSPILVVEEPNSEGSPVDKSTGPAPTPTSQPSQIVDKAPAAKADIKILESITGDGAGSVLINAAAGKLQMQASYSTHEEPTGVVSQPIIADTVPIVVSEIPIIEAVKPSKPPRSGNVNVNVNVNVNGDGTGSTSNTSSVAEIVAPIAAKEKCH